MRHYRSPLTTYALALHPIAASGTPEGEQLLKKVYKVFPQLLNLPLRTAAYDSTRLHMTPSRDGRRLMYEHACVALYLLACLFTRRHIPPFCSRAIPLARLLTSSHTKATSPQMRL